MKNILKTLSASALMLLSLAACQKEGFKGNEAGLTYTFEVSADQVATKASIDGDGTGVAVNRFIMEVYLEKNGDLVLLDKQTKEPTLGSSPKSTTFSLTLIKGQAYKVLFWADKANDDLTDLYYNTADLRAVSIVGSDDATYVGNNDALDAFSKMEVITAAESASGFHKSVKLTRPFGQVNFITTDIPAINALTQGAAFLPAKVKLEYNSCTVFNVLTGVASGARDFVYTAPVYSSENTATNPAKYTLSMDYMLTFTTENETRSSVKLTAYTADDYALTTVEVTNYPVQRNYRTNIIGNLLTSTNEFEVKVDPMWADDNDFTIVAPGILLASNGVYHLISAEGLVSFGKMVNISRNSFLGKTVVLDGDVDLTGVAFTPIGQTGATQFLGTFDGQGHTISNLNIVNNDESAHCATGLFGWLNTATVKNIKISGATITGHHNVGTIAGYMESLPNCTIEGCTVENATITCTGVNDDADGDKCGGIVGNAVNGGVLVKGCVVRNSSISAGRDAGQVVGAAPTANVVNCSAESVTVTANGSSTGANIREEVIGRVL